MYRLVPRGIQVALPQDTTVPLLEVHRTERSIHMVQGIQSVLHVHTDTHFLGTAQEDAHVSVPNFLKQGFAAVSVIVVHDGNLLGWYAGCYQFLFHIFIEIKAGDIRVIVKQVHLRTFPRRLIAIAEYKLRALVRCAFLVEFYNVAHDLVRLAVRIVRIARIQQPQVDGCLLGLGEHDQRQRALLAFGLPGQFIVIFQFTHQHVHHVLQVLVLVNDDVLHFPVSQLGDIFILLKLLHVIRQHNICMAPESLQQFRNIHITLEPVSNLEIASGRELQRRLYRTKSGSKIIKTTNVIGIKYVRRDKIHHRPYLCHRISNRCTGCKYHITPSVFLLYPTSLQQ